MLLSCSVFRAVALLFAGARILAAAESCDPIRTFAPPFVFQTTPMPAWLDASDWHRVRITVSQTTAQIDVAQGFNPYTTVLKASLLRPAEPLGFELSVDNELAPGLTVPVATPDGLDVDFLDIRTERVRS